jgi:hypothetical protein
MNLYLWWKYGAHRAAFRRLTDRYRVPEPVYPGAARPERAAREPVHLSRDCFIETCRHHVTQHGSQGRCLVPGCACLGYKAPVEVTA